jgi:ATP-dependent Clp protease ATP-binding subunit ClpA
MAVTDGLACYAIARRWPMQREKGRMAVAGRGPADNGRPEVRDERPPVSKALAAKWQTDRAVQYLRERVLGQDEALKTVARRIAVNLAKRKENPDNPKPIAVFLAVGPTGVGKTETAKALAEYMKTLDPSYGSITFDMSEFYERHTAANLVGAPKGYIGSDDPGRLTGAMDENPYRVVLFDEIEKGHPSVMNTFLQIFDEGRLTDASFGFPAYFNASIIFLTSNLASAEIGEIMEEEQDPVARRRRVLDILQAAGIRPEILARVNDVIPYRALDEQDYVDIVANYLRKLPRDRRPADVMAMAREIVDRNRALMPYGVREIIRAAEETVYG